MCLLTFLGLEKKKKNNSNLLSEKMILSALARWRKRFKDNTREIERKKHFDFKGFGFVYLLVWIFKSVPWWVLTQTSKVAWLRRKPCVQKTLKVSDFGLQSNHWLPNAYMLEHFYGEAPVLSFQRWAWAQHSCFDAFLCYLCAKKKHKRFSWNAVSLAANQ